MSSQRSFSGDDGAEPLAGLASAFLIAGGRAVLASHWTLLSDEAEQLTVGVRFDRDSLHALHL